MALAWLTEWVARHRRYAALLSYLVGAAGRETREMLRDPELMGRVETNAPFIRERVGLPDRFNELLGTHGWVTFEDMDVEVAREAVLLAKAGDLDGAEDLLVRHFDAERLRGGVERLCKEVPPFEARASLLLAAVEDHREGRYHASVPVALAQLDGIARDLTGKDFFVESKKAAHLIVRDSIIGHRSGLSALARVMSRQRPQTSSTEIDVPHRHGIMHGRDLAYANEKVSSKSLVALLALGSWVVERGREELDTEPPFMPFDPENIGLRDLLREGKGAAKALMGAWFGNPKR